MTKLHAPIRQACVETLQAVFANDRYAEKLVEYNLKSKKKWGARDRRQYAQIVYDLVRWWRLLAHLAQIDEPISNINGLIDFYLIWIEDPQKFKSATKAAPRAVRLSLPDELDLWGQSELGEQWEPMMTRLNQQAPQFLRANTLKTQPQELMRLLMNEGISTKLVSGSSSALVLTERKNVFKSAHFQSGLFEMQDAGSQLIAPFLQVEPGQRVIDACAGAGGKTLHLAAIMKNKGQIISLDIHADKLEEQKKRLRRAGVHIVETRCIDSSKVIKRLANSADRILLDVPCSGTGVLKRHPDTKWKFKKEEYERTLELQLEILLNYTSMLKPGGKVVYATCSIAPSENQNQVRKFLSKTVGQFELEEELFVSPLETDFDGFYAARILKK